MKKATLAIVMRCVIAENVARIPGADAARLSVYPPRVVFLIEQLHSEK